jgi:hypothetical protein
MAGYDGLVDMGYKRHYRVSHGEDEFAWGGGDIYHELLRLFRRTPLFSSGKGDV